ncbi:MAG TPA: glycosyltransferase [Verrucomicrobiota bacterium]|nr:glycosyltransferase [Verrucomicrobiota bacterium]
MAHIGMVVPCWIGHLNPMSALGRELQRGGHRITMISFPDAAERLSRAGLDHQVIGTTAFPEGDWERRTGVLSRLTGFAAAKYTIAWIARVSRVMLAELPETLRNGSFDGVVMDQVCYGAECAADEAGVPLGLACNALPVHFQPDIPVHSETWPWRTDPFSLFRNWVMQSVIITTAKPLFRPIENAQRAKGRPWNTRKYLNEVPPTLIQIAQLPACLDFPRRHAPDHFHHTGPWHEAKIPSADGFDWTWLDGRPLIYASLGTLQNGLDHVYQTILDACADLPVQVVVGLGRDHGPRPQRIPPNSQVLGYAPQLALLKRASLVITHAGLNTTLESLAQGLPMVALPITNEQPGIAARIRHAGVGEFLSLRRLTAARLRATLQQVSSDPSYRKRAQECAAQISHDTGLVRAAALLDEAFTSRRRVRREHGAVDSGAD